MALCTSTFRMTSSRMRQSSLLAVMMSVFVALSETICTSLESWETRLRSPGIAAGCPGAPGAAAAVFEGRLMRTLARSSELAYCRR